MSSIQTQTAKSSLYGGCDGSLILEGLRSIPNVAARKEIVWNFSRYVLVSVAKQLGLIVTRDTHEISSDILEIIGKE